MVFPSVHDPAYGLSAEALEYARQRYEDTEDSQRLIAEDIGKSRGTLDRIAKAQGWKLRKDRPPRGLSEAVKLRIAATEADEGRPSEAPNADSAAAPDATPVAGSVAERLEAALERELRKVENLRADLGRPEKRTQQSDRIARTLATLTETLFRVRRLAALYEQGKVKHVGCFPLLEDEMCDFGINGLSSGASPDRLDALVWAISAMLSDRYWDGPRITQL
jgi:hypothetical protein